ncbi:MAG TPA: hypothetical protein VMN36_16390 [Verrucomicrobiales bacterium]|nr:hypothetical protein [Verrucomicrobiales bacterium]
MKAPLISLIVACGAWASPVRAEDPWIVYNPPADNSNGRHLVFLTGDEEYRSEEGLPMLAKILSQRHGFRCTVLFSVNEDGTINPDKGGSVSHPEAMEDADALVMLLRFRAWPDEAMEHFEKAFRSGKPIVALRTSTHAFQFPGDSPWKDYNDFGKNVLGERWVSHWGRHKAEATLGVIEEANRDHPVLRGVEDVFGDTDVYEAYPPEDATILLRGQVLKGMKPEDAPADYVKKRASDGQEQGVNDPMMPVAWTRLHPQDPGKSNRVFCTTMGSSTDLRSEGLRRLVVNAVFWGLEMETPEKADVRYVGEYNWTGYGFGAYRKGVRPSDLALP